MGDRAQQPAAVVLSSESRVLLPTAGCVARAPCLNHGTQSGRSVHCSLRSAGGDVAEGTAGTRRAPWFSAQDVSALECALPARHSQLQLPAATLRPRPHQGHDQTTSLGVQCRDLLSGHLHAAPSSVAAVPCSRAPPEPALCSAVQASVPPLERSAVVTTSAGLAASQPSPSPPPG